MYKRMKKIASVILMQQKNISISNKYKIKKEAMSLLALCVEDF